MFRHESITTTAGRGFGSPLEIRGYRLVVRHFEERMSIDLSLLAHRQKQLMDLHDRKKLASAA